MAAAADIHQRKTADVFEFRRRCDKIKTGLACHIRDIYEQLQKGDTDNMAATYVYLNMLQESQEFVTSLRKMLRASGKLNLAPSTYRSFSHNAKPA